MISWRELWNLGVLGNEVGTWVVALGIFLVTFAVRPLFTRLFNGQRARRAALTGKDPHFMLDLALELADSTSRLFLWAAAVWLASRDLTFPPKVDRWLTVGIVVVFWIQMAQWAMTAVHFGIDRRRLRSGTPDTLLASSMAVIMFAAGLAIWGIATLLALDNLGVQIGPLLAGIGIGGIAIALAVQTVLADLLASLSIALDKPFTLGDSLRIDDLQGTVEHIGVKSTRLRSVSGEQIIIANADLLKARLRNFGRLFERRFSSPWAALRDPGREARRGPAPGARGHRGDPRDALRALHAAEFRRERARVRGGLLRDQRRTTRCRGCAARASTCASSNGCGPLEVTFAAEAP